MAAETSESEEDAVLDVEDLRFNYGDKQIVDLSRCTLAAGDSLAVIGPSGCGKTTFMHLLAGLLSPSSGSINVLGRDISSLGQGELDRFRGQHMGMVFQRLFLLPALTVRQNIRLAQQMARQPSDEKRIDQLIRELGLEGLENQKPRTLSQGQAQRVAIARALVHSPALILADEPTSALDDEHAEASLDLLKRSAARVNAGLLVVTHDERVRGQLGGELQMEKLS